MKKLVMFVVIVAVFLTSCQKETLEMYVDVDAIRAQVTALPAIQKEEVVSLLPSEKKLKDASLEEDENVIIYFYELDAQVIEINNTSVTRFFIYEEINFSGVRLKEYTISQTYQIVNGKVVTDSYSLKFEIGCRMKKDFYLENMDYVSDLIFYGRFDDGKQFIYISERYSGVIKLLPIKGIKWQIEGTNFDGDVRQSFMTTEVDFYGKSDVLSLMLTIKKPNIQSYIELNKLYIKGAGGIQLHGQRSDGSDVYLYYRFTSTEQLSELISFGAPFMIMDISMCGTNGCWWINTSDLITLKRDGKIVFLLP